MRLVGWIIKIQDQFGKEYEYRVMSTSASAAISRALRETKKEGSYEIRLGQSVMQIEVCRTHKKEIERWEKKGNKTIRP